MIKVLVVEDSPVVQEFLVHILSSDPDISVVGIAGDGEESLECAVRERPDVITMDIHMPGMNGLEATRKIMETQPSPIIIVSGIWNPGEVETTFRAMEAGALAVVRRPQGIGHPDHDATAKELISTVKLMSEVKVVRRWPTGKKKPGQDAFAARTEVKIPTNKIKAVAIGASTGGPPVLQTILSNLTRNFPAPLLIVQHMAAGFLGGFVEWLSQSSGVPLHIPFNGEEIIPGHAYFAPDRLHMGVTDGGRAISLSYGEPEHGARPSISFLFRSVSKNYGANAASVLLTGMGMDGASELKLMKDKGALTIIQDRASSAIYGMPGAAEDLDAAVYALSPEKIAAALMRLTKMGSRI